MDMVKVGIIGCGIMGRHHSKYLQNNADAKIIAASESNENVLNDYRREFVVKNVYADYEEMLSSEKLDAVVICLPTFLHHDAVTKAADRHINVFCEKPLARTLSQGEEMIQTCKENRVIFQVGFVRRFDNCWCKAKEIVENGVLGNPIVWRDVRAGFGPGYIPWFFDKEKGGGPILDGMVHNFDFGNFMFGKPVKVISGLTRFKKSSAMDTGSIWVEYESGHIMSNFWSWGIPEKVSSFSVMDIIGPNGALLFPEAFNSNEFSSYFDQENENLLLIKKSGGIMEPVVYQKNDLFLDQMDYFIDCVQHSRKPRVTGEDGLLALKVALVALKEEEL